MSPRTRLTSKQIGLIIGAAAGALFLLVGGFVVFAILVKSWAKNANDPPPTKYDRTSVTVVTLPQFATYPEEHDRKCVRLNGVWLHGGFKRVQDNPYLSPWVSSQDGKMVRSMEFNPGRGEVAFFIHESMGRPLIDQFKNDSKYLTNLFCEVRLQERGGYCAFIYQIEMLKEDGKVDKTYKDR